MDINNAVKQLKLYLFDMDGTLYLGNRLYDFTKELLQTIKQSGGRYMFMTNNSSKSVADYIIKLKNLGIDAAYEDFITSSQATAYYLKKHHGGKKLYVCGTQSLKTELINEGFSLTEDINATECIVMGFDTELTFKKLRDISEMLCTRDLPYIATNPDYVCPTEFGSVPDCGSIADALYNATGKRPVFIGKPEPLMPILAMEKTGYNRTQTAVVGDRIYTDVKSGINAGMVSILVMSGETTYEILEKSSDKPDFVLESAAEILKALKNVQNS
ncbi:MAG: HAD-IIA family hydrolase [Ruminococcaceae bacterium]|nr:HAD-IIA family hydrolase [Oscillospiraceae bacterium]